MLELVRQAISADVFAGLVVAAAVAGLVRGFAGFGSAMVFIPVASVLTGPQSAVVLLLMTDGVVSLPMLVRAARVCAWREVLPLGLGAAVTLPVGVSLLVVVDPTIMRWFISLLILVLIVLLGFGWRFASPPGLPYTAAVGGGAGLTGGMTGIAGPPVILFWMAGRDGARQIRANIIVFFGFVWVFNAVAYLFAGLLTERRVADGVALIPVFAVAVLAGALLFRFASESFFRRIAFALCAVAALGSLPLLDGVL